MNTSTAYALPPASTQPPLHPGAAVPPSAMTLEAFLVDYIQNHINQLTELVAREQRGMLVKYFGPLRAYALAEITPLMVESWFHEIGAHSQAQANKSLTILRTMFTRARQWRLFTGENPAQYVQKYTRDPRERFVTPDEMPRLQAVLARAAEDTQCFFLLCLLVGCRRTEGLTLKWADLDQTLRVWRKSKTKTRRAHTVPVPAGLLDRLLALPRMNEFVFASKHGHLCKTVMTERWAVIRKEAGLGHAPECTRCAPAWTCTCALRVTIHDLRRTCASWLAIHGENMAIISKGVLSHTSLAQTGIYTRLNVSPVTRALEENSVRMLGNGPSARPVIPPRTPAPDAGVVALTRGGAGGVAGVT